MHSYKTDRSIAITYSCTANEHKGPFKGLSVMPKTLKIYGSLVKWKGPFRFLPMRTDLEMIHFDRWDRSDRYLLFHFSKLVNSTTSLYLCRAV